MEDVVFQRSLHFYWPETILLRKATLFSSMLLSKYSDYLCMFRNGVSWAVYGLATVPSSQDRLREELLAVKTDIPTYDEINALPYLDAVVRETLRVFCPVVGTTRIALQDSIIPLAEPMTDLKGRKITEIL